jgi:hypothetical protein
MTKHIDEEGLEWEAFLAETEEQIKADGCGPEFYEEPLEECEFARRQLELRRQLRSWEAVEEMNNE